MKEPKKRIVHQGMLNSYLDLIPCIIQRDIIPSETLLKNFIVKYEVLFVVPSSCHGHEQKYYPGTKWSRVFTEVLNNC